MKPKGVGVFSCNPIQTFSLGLKMVGFYIEVSFLRLGETSIIIILKYTSNDSIETLVNTLFYSGNTIILDLIPDYP